MKHKLFLIDDHKIVRDGIKVMLLTRPDIQVVGEAASGSEALNKIQEYQPNITFVDLKLPDAKGSELLAELSIKVPNCKFALLTADPSAPDLKIAKTNGAKAFLTKDMETEEYLKALDQLIDGKMYISPSFSELLLEAENYYTPRELEVLLGFSDGLSYKEIGTKLGMSPRTVETHKNNLLHKMNVKSIVEMVRKAIRDGHVKA